MRQEVRRKKKEKQKGMERNETKYVLQIIIIILRNNIIVTWFCYIVNYISNITDETY